MQETHSSRCVCVALRSCDSATLLSAKKKKGNLEKPRHLRVAGHSRIMPIEWVRAVDLCLFHEKLEARVKTCAEARACAKLHATRCKSKGSMLVHIRLIYSVYSSALRDCAMAYFSNASN